MAFYIASFIVDCQVSQGAFFDKSTMVERYRCIDADDVPNPDQPSGAGLVLPYALQDGQYQTTPYQAVPVVGQAYPAPGTGSATWQETALCRSLQATPIAQHMDVVATYDTMYFYSKDVKKNVGGTVSDATDAPYLPARATFSIGTKEINVWRVNPTAPSATVNVSASDIGGTAVVSGITPIKATVATVKLRIRILIDSETQDIVAAASNISSFAGKRNTDTFMGFTAGKLVCTGGAVSHVEYEYFEASLEYEYDEYFENVQVPEMASDGRPKGGATGPTVVKWQRPVRTGAAFNDIFGSSEQGGVWRYMCENGRYYA